VKGRQQGKAHTGMFSAASGRKRGARLLGEALALGLVLSGVAAQEEHAEWCAGAGITGEDGERCPEDQTDGACPPGCEILTEKCATCGSSASGVAIFGSVLVLLAFFGGVLLPLMNPDGNSVREALHSSRSLSLGCTCALSISRAHAPGVRAATPASFGTHLPERSFARACV